MSAVSATTFADRLRRTFAAGCAALVFALTIFAASPMAHEWLHADGDEDTREHGCAVGLFASSAAVPMAAVELPRPIEIALTISPATAADIFLVTPRYLRQPERGPPVS